MYFWTVDGHRAIRIMEVTDEQPPWTPHRFGLMWIMLLNLGFHVLTGILLTNDIVRLNQMTRGLANSLIEWSVFKPEIEQTRRYFGSCPEQKLGEFHCNANVQGSL